MADITMFAGDTKTLQVTVKDENGDAVDLTGASIRWQASRSVNKRPADLEKSVGDGITITDATAGRFDVTLDSADTEDLRGDFYHEAEVIDASGNVSTVFTGTLTIEPTLIKPEDD